jgi:hypothetical protein
MDIQRLAIIGELHPLVLLDRDLQITPKIVPLSLGVAGHMQKRAVALTHEKGCIYHRLDICAVLRSAGIPDVDWKVDYAAGPNAPDSHPTEHPFANNHHLHVFTEVDQAPPDRVAPRRFGSANVSRIARCPYQLELQGPGPPLPL